MPSFFRSFQNQTQPAKNRMPSTIRRTYKCTMGLQSSRNPKLFTKISTSNRDNPQFCDIMSLAALEKEKREILLIVRLLIFNALIDRSQQLQS